MEHTNKEDTVDSDHLLIEIKEKKLKDKEKRKGRMDEAGARGKERFKL